MPIKTMEEDQKEDGYEDEEKPLQVSAHKKHNGRRKEKDVSAHIKSA